MDARGRKRSRVDTTHLRELCEASPTTMHAKSHELSSEDLAYLCKMSEAWARHCDQTEEWVRRHDTDADAEELFWVLVGLGGDGVNLGDRVRVWYPDGSTQTTYAICMHAVDVDVLGADRVGSVREALPDRIAVQLTDRFAVVPQAVPIVWEPVRRSARKHRHADTWTATVKTPDDIRVRLVAPSIRGRASMRAIVAGYPLE